MRQPFSRSRVWAAWRTERKARSMRQTRSTSTCGLAAASSSAAQARRPFRSAADAWSTYSAATVHPCTAAQSRSGRSWVVGSWSLSVVETRAYSAARIGGCASLAVWGWQESEMSRGIGAVE